MYKSIISWKWRVLYLDTFSRESFEIDHWDCVIRILPNVSLDGFIFAFVQQVKHLLITSGYETLMLGRRNVV